WQAGVLGKVRAYSSDLRHGLATTLALMGAYGGEPIAGARLTASEWAAWIVRQILEAANGEETARLWASLNDVIPLLAEAALVDFFRAWYPQTSLGPERRLAVIDRLRERHPAVAWNLLLGLLPALHSAAMPISEPEFRDWAKRDQPTHADLAGFYEAVTA